MVNSAEFPESQVFSKNFTKISQKFYISKKSQNRFKVLKHYRTKAPHPALAHLHNAIAQMFLTSDIGPPPASANPQDKSLVKTSIAAQLKSSHNRH